MENQVNYAHNAEKLRKEQMKNVRIACEIIRLKQSVILMYIGKVLRKSQLQFVKKKILLQRKTF